LDDLLGWRGAIRREGMKRMGKSIEAGLLICGGAAPARAADHVDALRASGDLARLN
jgi:hypothetical protein